MFPIIKDPIPPLVPVVVSIPHFGTANLPGFADSDFACARFASFPTGYTDSFSPQLYGSLHQVGASVLATPYSRMFVDVNRRRNDYQLIDSKVLTRTGVFRTHSIDGRALLARPLTAVGAERWLAKYYDPYHKALRKLLNGAVARWGAVCLIDAHTGSPNGMKDHEVILGTSHGRTADDRLLERAREIFERAGFAVALQQKGYSGGYIVKRYGLMRNAGVQALQIELNAGLFTPVSRREYIESLLASTPAPVLTERISLAKSCLHQFIRSFADDL